MSENEIASKQSGGLMEDVEAAKSVVGNLQTNWDGKLSVLELKAADYNWRQMEWWAFYFEYKLWVLRDASFTIPGRTYGETCFDAVRNLNWDIKAKAIKSDDFHAILNDKTAMDASIADNGEHGVMIGLCDVEYNDENRSFQQWHSQLKGGLSAYEQERRRRTAVSRYRKTKAVLSEILFLRIAAENVNLLATYKQGRNSNGKPRPPKYMIDLKDVSKFLVDRITFKSKEE